MLCMRISIFFDIFDKYSVNKRYFRCNDYLIFVFWHKHLIEKNWRHHQLCNIIRYFVLVLHILRTVFRYNLVYIIYIFFCYAVRTYTADFFDISYLITHYYEILIVWIFVEYIFIVIDTCLNKILKHTWKRGCTVFNRWKIFKYTKWTHRQVLRKLKFRLFIMWYLHTSRCNIDQNSTCLNNIVKIAVVKCKCLVM